MIKPLWTEQIREEFPQFFKANQEISCGNGWYNILRKLCQNIRDQEVEFKFLQIKEKFAALRIHYECSHYDKIKGLVSGAEEESLKVCENCGSRESVSTGGGYWIKTLCKRCNKVI